MNPRSRKLIVSGVLMTLLLLALMGALLPSVAQADVTTDAKAPQLTGLAADREQDLWWSADRTTATVSAIDGTGQTKGTVAYQGTPVDVQATAVRKGRVFVGDVGDAQQQRTSIDVYALSSAQGSVQVGQQVTTTRYRLAYPDGPHDAAAMTVSPNGRIYVITRGDKPGVYRTSPTPSATDTNPLTRITDAPVWVTDATYTADGSKLVLRTETSVTVLDGNSFKAVAAAELPATAKGNALATGLAGDGLVVADSGKPAKLVDVALPTTLAQVDAAPAPSTAAASASASASATPKPAAPANAVTAAPRTGTMAALGAAALISLLAGLVVALRR